MPPIRFLVSKRLAYYFKLVAIILSLSKIMPTYSRYILKGLVYIAIIAPLGCQPSSYTKCTKLNMRSSCDVKSVFNTKYACLIRSYVLRSPQLFYLIWLRVLCNSYRRKAQF